jgi:hypothetical protein
MKLPAIWGESRNIWRAVFPPPKFSPNLKPLPLTGEIDRVKAHIKYVKRTMEGCSLRNRHTPGAVIYRTQRVVVSAGLGFFVQEERTRFVRGLLENVL